MNKQDIYNKIEAFAPLELAESWDCSGVLVETPKTAINKIMFALTVTEDVIKQAKEQNCDMIISHHPLFYIPLEWRGIDIYCAHTNMDKTNGGTTDELIKTLGLPVSGIEEFVRYVKTDTTVEEFARSLSGLSPDLRYVNMHGVKNLHKIAFCAGSGTEFIKEAKENGADAFVSGDLKFHTALESELVVFDIGHFESEIPVLKVFAEIVGDGAAKVFAEEKSPFIYYTKQ